MKIETGGSHAMVPSGKTQTKGVARPREEAPATRIPDAAFNVTLSRALERSTASTEDDEEIRRAKVAAIREQLASGSYNISGKDVAGKILDAIKG